MLNEPANSLAIDWGSTQLEVGLRCYGENPPNPHMEIIADEIASKYLGEMPDRIILHVKNRIIGLRCGTITHVGGLRWDDPDTGITYILIADLSTAGYPRTHRHEIYHSFGSGGDYISDIGGRGQNDENIMYFKATQDAGAHIGIYPRQEVSTGNGDPITDQLERQWHKTERE